jgi:hypothetical protein
VEQNLAGPLDEMKRAARWITRRTGVSFTPIVSMLVTRALLDPEQLDQLALQPQPRGRAAKQVVLVAGDQLFSAGSPSPGLEDAG